MTHAIVETSGLTEEQLLALVEAVTDTGDAFTDHADWYPDPVRIALTEGTPVKPETPVTPEHWTPVFGV